MDLHYTRHEVNIKLLNFLLEKQDFTNGGDESAKTTKTVTKYHLEWIGTIFPLK